MDQPSGLYEQLCWLEEAGFSAVDVVWLKAGHAIYGGWQAE
jgi:tRNA (cmo5U34)-methyltransferase